MSNNNINTTNALSKDYSSIRIETYQTGKGKRRYSYSPENEQKARDFANGCFKNGYKVTLYWLDGYKVLSEEVGNTVKEELESSGSYKSVNVSSGKGGEGYIVWAHGLETTADGREQKGKKTTSTKKSTKSKSESKAKTEKTKEVAKPVAPSGACEGNEDKRIEVLEKQVADLTVAVQKLAELLTKSAQ